MKKRALSVCAAIAAPVVFAAVARADLVAYFPVDSATDTSNFLDDIIDDPTHAVTDGTTTNNNATIMFDATRGGDVVHTPDGHFYRAGDQDINIAGTGGFTWSFWVKVNSNETSSHSIIGTRNGSWHKVTVASGVDGPGVADFNYTGGFTFADDTWHHVAYVGEQPFVGTANVKFYVDGVIRGTDTSINTAQYLEDMDIGGTGKFGETVDALMDDIAIYDQALSEQEVLALLNGADPRSIPEPASLALLALGGVAIARRR